jgi:hypothetical protein
MGHRRRSRSNRGLLDAGPAGVAWGLLMAVTAAGAIVILFWLFYVLLMGLMSLL